MDVLTQNMEFVRELVVQGQSHNDIGIYFKNTYPHLRGFSARNIRRFCKLHEISRPSQIEVDEVVSAAVREVGIFLSIKRALDIFYLYKTAFSPLTKINISFA